MSLRVGYVSEAYLLAGRLEEAVHLAGRALDLARAHKERGHEAWALRLLGEIAAHQAPRRSSRPNTHYRQALALAEELGMRPLMAHCHLGLGTLYAKTGQREQARAELSMAIDAVPRHGHDFLAAAGGGGAGAGGGAVMDFLAVVDQVIELLRSRGRVSYRALKLQLRWMMTRSEALKD